MSKTEKTDNYANQWINREVCKAKEYNFPSFTSILIILFANGSKGEKTVDGKKSQQDPHLLLFLRRVCCDPSCSNLLEDFHGYQLAFPQCTFQKKLHWDVHLPLRTFYLQMLAKWGNMNCIENTVHTINILPEKSNSV